MRSDDNHGIGATRLETCFAHDISKLLRSERRWRHEDLFLNRQPILLQLRLNVRGCASQGITSARSWSIPDKLFDMRVGPLPAVLLPGNRRWRPRPATAADGHDDESQT